MEEHVLEELVEAYSKERVEYEEMLACLKKVRGKADEILDNLTPKKGQDYRQKGADKYSKFAMEEKMKTLSSLLTTELSIRRVKTENVIKEIELRNKLDKETVTFDIEDIGMLAKQLEKIEAKSKGKPLVEE